MTSNHPWLADVFFLSCGNLFLAKFLTWEEARQQDAPKRRNSYALAIGSTLLVLVIAIAGNHWINRNAALSATQSNSVPSSPSVGNQPERKGVEDSPKAGARTPPQEHFPENQPKPTKPQGKTHVKGQGSNSGNSISGSGNVIGDNNQVTISPNQTLASPPPVQAIRIVSQDYVSSDDPSAPYELKIVVQTNVLIQPVSFLFDCTENILKKDMFHSLATVEGYLSRLAQACS